MQIRIFESIPVHIWSNQICQAIKLDWPTNVTFQELTKDIVTWQNATTDAVWIGNQIYWTLNTHKYK